MLLYILAHWPIIPQLFTYCPTDGHWDCFQFLPIVNSNFSSVLIKLLSCLAYLTFIIQPKVFMKWKTLHFEMFLKWKTCSLNVKHLILKSSDSMRLMCNSELANKWSQMFEFQHLSGNLFFFIYLYLKKSWCTYHKLSSFVEFANLGFPMWMLSGLFSHESQGRVVCSSVKKLWTTAMFSVYLLVNVFYDMTT